VAAVPRSRLPKPMLRPWRSKTDGNHQDYPDRVADPSRRQPARDPDRSWPQQDAQNQRTDGYPRGSRHDPQGSTYGEGGGLNPSASSSATKAKASADDEAQRNQGQ